jgi:5-methylcytosine-specific restriction endonuclease McrA
VKPRNAVVVVLAAGLAWFATRHVSAPRHAVAHPGTDTASTLTARTNGVIDQVQSVVRWIAGAIAWSTIHPWLIGAVAGLVVVGALIHLVRSHRSAPQDPQRMYTPEQRKQSFELAGGRCEYTGFLLTRCRRPAEHADHLYPWSKGGATSLANCCAACQHCNLSKGAKILPAWRVRLLVHRRKRYYPVGVDRACGQMFTERYAAGGMGVLPGEALRGGVIV